MFGGTAILRAAGVCDSLTSLTVMQALAGGSQTVDDRSCIQNLNMIYAKIQICGHDITFIIYRNLVMVLNIGYIICKCVYTTIVCMHLSMAYNTNIWYIKLHN